MAEANSVSIFTHEFPLPHVIWALYKGASMYVVYINPSIRLMLPSLLRDSPLKLIDHWHNSTKKQMQEIIQVDLACDVAQHYQPFLRDLLGL